MVLSSLNNEEKIEITIYILYIYRKNKQEKKGQRKNGSSNPNAR